MTKRLLYLNTNGTWGGSEILWSLSAKRFLKKGWAVRAAVYFDYERIKDVFPAAENYLDLRQRFVAPGFTARVLQKLQLHKFPTRDLLVEELLNNQPDLVIISQGNNKDGEGLMQCCVDLAIPFVNIIQLVSESLWPGLNDEKIDRLNLLFDKAAVNYFVSKHTLQMHTKILGKQLSNAQIMYNPFSKAVPENLQYPPIKNGLYKVALIGRLEMFHKGYDLLLEVVQQKKWQERNISFSLFGQGPHKELIKRSIQRYGITNMHVYSHTEEVADIWQEHHLLFMPSRMEGQSLTLIEAMRFKRAVVATDVGGVAELIEEGLSGFIATYPTAFHVDAALERAWQARTTWEQMGLNAFEHISTKHPQDAVGYFNDEIEMVIGRVAQSMLIKAK